MSNISFSTEVKNIDIKQKKVDGYFDCSNTSITSLEGAPEEVGRFFDCSHTRITSLKGAPKKVGRFFDCSCTKIASLKGAPEEVGDFFDCSNTRITSLEGAPKKCKALLCRLTRITKKQAIDYLRHNDCDSVTITFERIYKKNVIKKLTIE